MKLFCYGDTDTFVAADEEDAWRALVEVYGGKREDFDDPPGECMEELADDAVLKIWCNAEGHPDEPHSEGCSVVAKAAAEWAASEPRGMLCSTEY